MTLADRVPLDVKVADLAVHDPDYKRLTVAIDDHVCSYREPETAETFTFEPSEAQRDLLGDVRLIIKVACAPLPQVEQGITITSGLGNLVAIERAGIETKEFGNYLFGDIDVPALENHPSPIAPYDPTRSLQLNAQHPLVAILLGFIGSRLEEVRASLVRKSKEARKTEPACRLALEAEKIAQILNDDFRKISDRLHEIRAASSHRGSAQAQFGAQATDEGTDDWVRGTQSPGSILRPKAKNENDPTSPKPPRPEPPQVQTRGWPDNLGDNAVDPIGGLNGKRRRPQGGSELSTSNSERPRNIHCTILQR